MPHVIVKLWPGKTEQQKRRLAHGVTKAITASRGYDDDAASVSFEEVEPVDWTAKVHTPDIITALEGL